jgi:predicted TIM-barrel fold metal-dependent hydrolase
MKPYLIIDAHSHLWLHQDTTVDGKRIKTLTNGRSEFMGEIRQMLPPFMIDGYNTAEVFLSNMDYAQVSTAVVVQEFIDGIQNDYLSQINKQYSSRFITCGMCDYLHNTDTRDYHKTLVQQTEELLSQGFSGMAIPGHRLHLPDGGRIALNAPEMMEMYKLMETKNAFLSLTLEEDNSQLSEVEDIITEYPHLRIAIGHFGMVTTSGWMDQIRLARHPNVMIESGGITWLFNSEFYPFNGAVKAILQAADEVGMDKLMWGSDYPRTITAITYRMSYDFIIKNDSISDCDKRMFLGENAQRFYSIHHPVNLPYIKNMSE